MNKINGFVLILAFGLTLISCVKTQDKLQSIDPNFVIKEFFESWKVQDWKRLYTMTHPAIIQKIRMQNLSVEEQNMSDEQLFIMKFDQTSKANPDKIMRTYEVQTITQYKPGDTAVWVTALVNGKQKKIPLALEGLSLKVDLTRIE